MSEAAGENAEPGAAEEPEHAQDVVEEELAVESSRKPSTEATEVQNGESANPGANDKQDVSETPEQSDEPIEASDSLRIRCSLQTFYFRVILSNYFLRTSYQHSRV